MATPPLHPAAFSILLAEDEPSLRELLRQFLEPAGFHLTMVNNGAEAITALQGKTVDLVITDIRMPQVDGMELLRHIKKNFPAVDVMVITGFPAEYSFTDVIRAGATDYLIKPFSSDDLYAKIDRIISERQLRADLERAKNDLEQQVRLRTRELEETNTALQVLLRKREQDKTILEEQVILNVRELILPYLEKLRQSPVTSEQQRYLEIINANLDEIISPFVRSMLVSKFYFTPSEMKIANLIRRGKTSKEIADILHLSPDTVSVHRKNMRKKSGIANTKINLRTLLNALDSEITPRATS